MGRLRKFRRLPRRERVLLLQALLLLGAVRLGIKVLPLQRIMRLTQRPMPHGARRIPPTSVGWAVTVASRYVPGAACLTQALAAQVLLNRAGIPTALRIGVAKAGEDLAAP